MLIEMDAVTRRDEVARLGDEIALGSWPIPISPAKSVLDEAHCSAEHSRRIACDASRILMKHDADGRVVEVGARTRTSPPALRRALEHRDRGCRFPGCGSRFTQGHHIKHWANGGPTTLSNLASLCRRHHRAVHEEGFQLERVPDGRLQFRSPQGWVIDEAPPPPDIPGAMETLNAGTQRLQLSGHG